jgi:Flp pilus assembly protein TadD
MTLALAATLAERLKRRDEALAYTRRLVAVNPWMWGYHVSLARLLARKADWAGARTASEAAVKLNPFDVETRMLLIAACVHTADGGRAEKEFAALLALNPDGEQKLREWFAAQRRARPE